MNTEFEAKFLNIDIDEIRNKLKSMNAELVMPMHQIGRAHV